jgi:hypothetical protein
LRPVRAPEFIGDQHLSISKPQTIHQQSLTFHKIQWRSISDGTWFGTQWKFTDSASLRHEIHAKTRFG